MQTPSTLISFCTAVIVEVLGCVATVNSDIVKRILPFVVSGIQAGSKQSLEHKVSWRIFEEFSILYSIQVIECIVYFVRVPDFSTK